MPDDIHGLLSQLAISPASLKTLSSFFEKELEAGIQHPTPPCSLDVSPTFVTRKITPYDAMKGDAVEEKSDFAFPFSAGTFFGVDVGGTHCRVLRIVLTEKPPGPGGTSPSSSPGSKMNLETTHVFKTVIPDHLRKGEGGTELFDFIAQCIEKSLQPGDERKAEIPLGLSFSFGVRATAIDHGILYACGKEWNMNAFFGRDVSDLLREAFVRNHLHDRVLLVALLNDTVGTLISGFFDDPRTSVGMILGTGTNMCLWDNLTTIAKLSTEYRSDHPDSIMVVNTEWGSIADPKFDPNSPLTTLLSKVDHLIDVESMVPGDRMFEKMISGMYLGEITRLVMVEASQLNLVESKLPAKFFEKFSLSSPDVSTILSDHTSDLTDINSLLLDSQFEWVNNTLKDRLLLREIARAVVTRCGRLVAAALAALYRYMTRSPNSYLHPTKGGYPPMVVAVEGSVYEKLEWCRQAIAEGTAELLGEVGPDGLEDQNVSSKKNKHCPKIELKIINDGSGRGAALLAALCVGNGQKAQKQ